MKIICLEGCSGSGKTTQHNLLREYFSKVAKKNLFVVEKDYEPFKTRVEEWHKNKGPSIPLNHKDIGDFAKARAESIKRNFLNKNLDFLILDRYYYTSAVYQSNREISPEEILFMNKHYGSPTPEISFLFECSPEIAFERSDKRNKYTGGKHLFSTDSSKIKEIQERYRGLLEYCPELKIINTEKTIEEITQEIISNLKQFI